MGALILPAHARQFPRAVLIEGGYHEWDLAAARKFKANGGERIAFVCGVRGCQRAARRSVAILERAQVEASLRHATGAGHTYLGRVEQESAAALAWLFEADARWVAPGATNATP